MSTVNGGGGGSRTRVPRAFIRGIYMLSFQFIVVARSPKCELSSADGIFHWASAQIIGHDRVFVMHPKITEPTAVRFGWADNPVFNLFDRNGLPVTPFRTHVVDGISVDRTAAAP